MSAPLIQSPTSSAQGLVNGLVSTGFLIEDERRYRLGPAPYLLVFLGVFAVLLQQSAFHAGALQMSVPTMLVLEPVVAVFLGAILLGEELNAGRYEAIALTLAIAAMTAATVALGRDEGAYEAELEIKAARRAA